MKWGLVFFWGHILKDCLTYRKKSSSQDVKKNSPRAYSRSIITGNIERRFVSAFYLLLGSFFLEKGFFGGQINKKWGLVFFWCDILDYFKKTYGMKCFYLIWGSVYSQEKGFFWHSQWLLNKRNEVK